jgi:replicative DNA helicase
MSESGERRRGSSARNQEPAVSTTVSPPWDEAAERAVLGAVFFDPQIAVTEIVKSGLLPDHFYREGHRAIMRAILELDEAREGIDNVTVANRMAASGTLQLIESALYLARLGAEVPTVENVGHYARVVREKAILREILAFGQETVQSAVGDVENVGHLVDHIARRAMQISAGGLANSATLLGDILKIIVPKVDALGHQKKGLAGTPTGFPSLDKVTAGWQASDLVILAARPAMGKTAFALNLLVNAARDKRKPTAGVVFSLEMSAEQLAMRVWAANARIPVEQMRSGALSKQDWLDLAGVVPDLVALPVFIDDTPQISIPEMLRKCRQLKAEHDIGLIMVDYLQLMKGSSVGRNTSREQEISEISRGLKALAKELNVPVIALSQLNRGVESRKDKRPMLSDLRESGAIEQDADIVMFLHRDDYYRDEDGKQKGGDGPPGPSQQQAPQPLVSKTEVIIAKHRSGATTTVHLLFHGRFTLFMDEMPGPDMGGTATRVDLGETAREVPTPGRYRPPPGPEDEDDV